MAKKCIEHLKSAEIDYCDLPEERNKVIVETAGFVPLEVKFKRFEQNGMMAQFHASEFTSQDYRDMYLNPDFEITPEDDYEDIQEKVEAQAAFIHEREIERKKSKTSDITVGNSEVAPQADIKGSEKQEKSESDVDKQ